MSEATVAEVRPVRPGDVPGLVSLIAAHAVFEGGAVATRQEQLANALFTAPFRLFGWVAADGGRLLGYATATREFSTWLGAEYLHMDCLFVVEGARNQRLGARLLKEVINFAETQNLGEVQWQTPLWNLRAARFYRLYGAEAVEKHRFMLRCKPDQGGGM